MKAGFLGGGKAAAKRQQQAAAQAALQQTAGASTSAPDPSAPAQAPTAPLDPARWQANWQQCLALLRTDQDESRFVGLLMATKLLPQGGDDAIQQVVEAVGFTFLQRLLLPLAQQQQLQEQLSVEARQKQQVSCAVGLAILSAACRLPGIAGSSDMQRLLPQLMTAAAQGLPGADATSTSNDEDAAARTAAVTDALECVLAYASSSSDAAWTAASSNGVAAAAAALQRAVRLPATSNNTVVRNGQAMLSMRLLECMLEALSGDEQQQQLLNVASSLGGARAGEMAVVAAAQLLGEGADTASTSRPAAGAAPDTAMLQLEALHTLLLLLSGGVTPASDAPSADQEHWADDVRSGLERLLRSRVGAVQKQSALQVAALLEERLGPAWLLPGIDDVQQPQQQRRKQQQQQAAPGSFLSVLVEMLCVELPLLLSDAMNPDAIVPDSRGRTAAQAAQLPAQPVDAGAEAAVPAGSGECAEAEAHDQEDDSMAVDEQPGSSTPAAGKQQQPADSDGRGAASAGADTADAAAGASAGPSHAVTAGASEQRTARERAEEGLPACFSLLEAVIAVLADDEEAAEAAAEAEGASWRLPVLEPAVRGRLAARLSDTAQVLLDFLAYMEEHGGPGVEQDALVSGAVRLLGGFLAQAPEVHSEAVRRALPFLLSAHSPGDAIASGAAYMMPALSQLVDPSKSAKAAQWALRIARSDAALGALVAHAERLAAAAVRAASRAGASGQGQQQEGQQARHEGTEVAEEEMDAGSLEGMLSAVSDVLTRVLEAAAAVHEPAGPSETAPGTSAAIGADASSQRSGVTNAVLPLLPLLRALPAWAEALHGSLRAELQPASSSDAYLQALDGRVRPQGLAYVAHLVAAALRAALQQLGGPAAAAMAPLPANALEGQGVSAGDVEAACGAVLWALEAGYHCERYLLQASEVESDDEFSEAAMLQADLREDAEDMLEPRERCLGAAVGVLELSQPMQEAALRQAWVQSALREEGGRQEAAHSVNLRLFLSTLKALGAS